MIIQRNHIAAVAVIAVITVASGAVHGYLDGRLTDATSIEAMASKLDAIPDQVGPWTLVSDQDLPENAQRILRCDGYVNREYWNPQTGDRVYVAVLMGPRGPIAVHTPEICFSSTGTEPMAPRQPRSIETGGQNDRLWNLQFAQPGQTNPELDVWYGWSDGGPWQASENPRFWLTDRLYKIQLASRPAADGGGASGAGGGKTPAEDFLNHFLPALRQAI